MGNSESSVDANPTDKTKISPNQVTQSPESKPVHTSKTQPQRAKRQKADKKKKKHANGGYDITDGPHIKRLSEQAIDSYNDSLENMRAESESIAEIPFRDYEFPFENMVFEGGGAKGQVYIGCLKVMDEVGVVPRRVAGASAGAICAALVAAGYSAQELEIILEDDLTEILMDHSCGLCSFLPNLVRHFGWNPGQRFLEVFGELIADKLGDPDITFKQLYQKTGKELCVTAVNVNMLAVEYFHPKTTPNMSVRLAVRMSLSIPGIFQPVRVTNSQGNTDVYIDGGLLCNYPIHAFDGWWLSMKKDDSFLNRIQPLHEITKLMDKKERFGSFNEKTLGFLVYSSLEQDLMQEKLENRVGVEILDHYRPQNSKLYNGRAGALKSKAQAVEEHKIFMHALDKFLKALNGANGAEMPEDDVIDKNELKQALKQALDNSAKAASLSCDSECEDTDAFTQSHVEILFGQNANIDAVFDNLDSDDSGYISYDELMEFVERSGIDIQSKFQGYDRRELNSLGDFAVGLQDCLLTNVKKMYLEDRDVERTVGINTDYIGTTDFTMADCDRKFCIEQGRRATESFLKHYVHEKKPPRKGISGGQPSTNSQQNNQVSNGENRMHDITTPEYPFAPVPAIQRTQKDCTALPPIRGTVKMTGSPRIIE